MANSQTYAHFSWRGEALPTTPRTHDRIRIFTQHGGYDVVPSDRATAGISTDSCRLPITVIPIWRDVPLTVEGQVAESAFALEQARQVYGSQLMRAAVYAADRSWASAAIAIPGSEPGGVWRPQDVHYVVETSGVTVVAAGATETRTARVVPVVESCPMRLDGSHDPCVPAGGPWTSHSRATRLVWNLHHEMLSRVLGGGCESGANRGGIVGVVPMYTPTRHRTWLSAYEG